MDKETVFVTVARVVTQGDGKVTERKTWWILLMRQHAHV